MTSPSRHRSSSTSQIPTYARPESAVDGKTAPEVGRTGLFSIYKQQLKERPRITNAIVSMLISSTADMVAQAFERGTAHGLSFSVDVRRTCALAATAFTYNGFILTSWLIMLNTALPGAGMGCVLKKLALTQTLLQPFVYVPFFFVFHGLLIGQTLQDIFTRFTSDYFSLLLRLWSLFMPTRLLMFVIIPPPYQVLWDSSVSFFWQVALSLFDAAHAHPKDDGGLVALVTDMKDMDPFGSADWNNDFAGRIIHERANVAR